ncbi:MAG: TonB-dependent receptor, partial [Porphyromonas sp.]|nr:TonB-dependent receptor [Porphyromonas sp.]
GVSGSFVKDQGDNGVGRYSDLILSHPSYYSLRDQNGQPTAVPLEKSRYEIERLISLGLQDESFIPILNRKEQNYNISENYIRLHAGMKFKIAEGLNLDLKYQSENTDIKDRQYYSPKSHYAINMINDAAQYDKVRKTLKLNIPTGGQLRERYSKAFSYTMRAQMNFNRDFDKHTVSMLAGAERRLIRTTGSSNLHIGYDDSSLAIKPIDPAIFKELKTESLSGSFVLKHEDFAQLIHNEDRFVSFYANGSYTYDHRYSVTGSIRIDQSNLFGTDPKLQYRPLWSVGMSWYLGNEAFMKDIDWINQLNLRLTSGVGGNIPKDVGPFLNIKNQGANIWSQEFSSSIISPPNSALRWEKTTSNNFGIDFALFNSRFNGSIDLYHKSTTDLLGKKNADPTLGWQTLTLNYGSMVNKGFELSLQAAWFKRKKFSWDSNLILSYNDNKLINLSGTKDNVFQYTTRNIEAVGYPVNSLFSYRYAGLSERDGSVLVYNSKGEKVPNVTSISDLVYSGTRDPKVTASLRNSFSMGDFDLSFMFVYYGGHVMRDVVADYLSGAPRANINRKILNMWRQPGDETKSEVTPGFKQNISNNIEQAGPWYSADIHVKKADYIKLRDVSLSYNIRKDWLKKLAVESATLTCQISDLWWWSANGDIDPEAYAVGLYGKGSLTLPIPTTYTLGLSLNF